MFKAKGSGIVWDAEKNTVLAKFVKGVFLTDDEAVAMKLKSAGYTVEDEVKPAKGSSKKAESAVSEG